MRPRIRTIKPEAHTDEALWDLEVETGLPIFRAFVGLWNFADREGRFEWRARPLKAGILPYWDGDFARVLDALGTRGFVRRYTVAGREYGLVVSFTRHQSINNREDASELPAPEVDGPESPVIPPTPTREPREEHVSPTRAAPVPHATQGEGKGREGKGTERNPRARAGDGSGSGVSGRTPMERARSALVAGYQHRYEAEAGDAWVGHGANGQAIATTAAWCAAEPAKVEQRAEDVLEGLFADEWASGTDERGRHRRWPWGAVAKDPAKYAEAGRIHRSRATKRAKLADAEAAREAEERDREARDRREAAPPPAEARAMLRALTGGIGLPVGERRAAADERQREERAARQRELDEQAAQIRAGRT